MLDAGRRRAFAAAFRVERALAKPRAHVPRAAGRQTILIVDDLLPDPRFGAGYPRARAIVRSLVAAGHTVEHYPMQSSPSDHRRIAEMFGPDVRFHRGRGAIGLHRLLWRDGSRYDLLFVSRPGPMAALRTTPVTPGNAGIVYDAEAVMTLRDQRRAALFGTAWSDEEYRLALDAELALAEGVQAISAVGRLDADLIRSVLDIPVFVLPHSVDVRAAVPGPDGRSGLLFVGRLTGGIEASPNVDSLHWFVTAVMPRLDRLIGTDYRLEVVGRLDAPDLALLASDRVVFRGVVDDIRPLYDRSRLFIAPTRYAAGIPLKVLEAMGEGLPCVATPLLGEQLGTDADMLAVGGDPDAFAAQCARLYRDDRAWSAAQSAGLGYARATGAPEVFDATLAELVAHATPPA